MRILTTTAAVYLLWLGLVQAPGASQQGLDRVAQLAEAGETEPALAAVEEYLRQAPDDLRGRFLRGVLLSRSERLDEAKSLFAELIRQQPERVEAYNNLAVLYAQTGDFEAAAEVLKAGLRTAEAYRVTYDNLNMVFGQLAGLAYGEALGEDAPVAPVELPLELLVDLEGVAAVPQAISPPSPPETARTDPQPVTDSSAAGGVVEHDPADLMLVVERWARAWSSQDVDRYLSFYGSTFLPADGTERSAWEDLRRRRLAAPSFIEVSVAFIDSEFAGAEEASVSFIQQYRSDSFSDTVRKRLDMVWESGWKIRRDVVE